MQVKKQQLELDMEQWIGSEWGKEYDKAVYCNLVYLTSMQSAAAFAAKSLQSCLTLCDPIDGSPPGSPIPGILQARTLEWVAISTLSQIIEFQRGLYYCTYSLVYISDNAE